jgi:TctA family transporter
LRDQPELLYSIFARMILASLIMLLIGWFGLMVVAQITRVPPHVVIPIVIFFCLAGMMLQGYGTFGLVILIAFAVLGYLMKKFDYSFVTFLVAFIITPMLELNLRQSITLSRGDPMILLNRPIAVASRRNLRTTSIGKKASEQVTYRDQTIARMTVIRDIARRYMLVVKGSAIGTVVGLLPGVGTTLAVFMSYAEAKRSSKTPETFEHGIPEGVIAAESANSATVGSSLVPLLALGVPGSPTSAIIAGALVIHGIILGPSLFVNRPDVAFIFLYGMLLTVFAMTLIGAFGIKYFSYILKIRMDYIVPTVLALALFGAYSLRNSLFDVGLAIALGILGAIFKKVAIPLAPIIIGVVLGPLIESNLARSMTIANARGMPLAQYMLSSTLAIGLLVLVLALLVVVIQMRRRTAAAEAEATRRTSDAARRVTTAEG